MVEALEVVVGGGVEEAVLGGQKDMGGVGWVGLVGMGLGGLGVAGVGRDGCGWGWVDG